VCVTEEVRVNMKNILTVPWKEREAADSVGSIMCCTVIITEKECGGAGGCSLLQMKVKMLVLAGYDRIQSTGGQDESSSEHYSMLKKWFTIPKFKLNNEVLKIFASILWFLKKLQNQRN